MPPSAVWKVVETSTVTDEALEAILNEWVGQGYTFDARAHLFVVDVATGETRQITDGDFDDAAESWSPDGRQIAFARTRGGNGDYSSRDIWVIDVATGAALRITEDVYLLAWGTDKLTYRAEDLDRIRRWADRWKRRAGLSL